MRSRRQDGAAATNRRTAGAITCPCCFGTGQIEQKAPVPLSPMQLRIFDIVRRSKYGIESEAVAERVYAGCAGGGPIWARQVVRMQVWRANERLAKANLRIGAATRGGPYFLLQTGG